MIVLLRSTDGCPDSRLEKYVDTLESHNIEYCTVCWDRNCKLSDSGKNVYYHRKSQYSLGWKNICGLVGFNLFIFKWLWKNRKNIRTIHACDFDTVLPAMLFKLLFHCIVIYDIFDWYVDSRNLSILKYVVLLLEWGNLKLADVTLICEEERKKQLCTLPRKCWVLPNIPNLIQFKREDFVVNKYDSTIIRISYVGILSRNRGLENVLKFVSEHPFTYTLSIAGFGELESLVDEYAKRFENIIFYGAVKYSKGLEIMYNSDIIMAIYELSVPNHLYAAPNKYYEGLFLGKPILTTKGTLVGNKTEDNGTGFVIEDSFEALVSLLNRLTKKEIASLGEVAESLWTTKYSTYVNDFMNNYYLPFIVH